MGRKLADDGIAAGNIFLKNTKRLAQGCGEAFRDRAKLIT
jgi:hypothetical protein